MTVSNLTFVSIKMSS